MMVHIHGENPKAKTISQGGSLMLGEGLLVVLCIRYYCCRILSTVLLQKIATSFLKPYWSRVSLACGVRSLSRMGRGIPDRWLEYTKLGAPMKFGKAQFISFKVPLKPELTQSRDEGDAFTPSQLMDMCKESGHTLGLVIDLTFTKRYYCPTEFTEAGVQHVKIPIEGQVIPRRPRVDKFNETVGTFLKKSNQDDMVIGVHCTHGVNRTGYIICKYLVEQENMNADEAIELFNTCRGHEIEREAYLNNLRTGHIPEAEKGAYHDAEYDAPQWNTKPQNNTQRHTGGDRYQYYDRRNDGYGWRNDSVDNYSHYGRQWDNSYYNDDYSYNRQQGAYSRGYDPYYNTRRPYRPREHSHQYDNQSYQRDDFTGSTSFDNRQHTASSDSGYSRQQESDRVSKKRSRVDESQETSDYYTDVSPIKKDKRSSSREEKKDDSGSSSSKKKKSVKKRLG